MKLSTLTLIAAAAGCTLAGAARAQVAEDAKKVLTESSQAMNRVESMSYTVKKTGMGALEPIINVNGEVRCWRSAPGKPLMVYAKGKIKNPGSEDRLLEVSYDGTNVTWLDWSKNTMYTRPMSDSMGREDIEMSKQLFLQQFSEAEPFKMEFGWPILRKEAPDKVNGEMCDMIIAQPDDTRQTVWAISVADRLPRRFEQAMPGKEKIGWVTNISDVKTGMKFTAKDFEIQKPTGFIEDKQNQAATGQAPELGIKVGATAPDFKGTDPSGKEYSLSSLKGNAVVLQFFGTMFKASTAACAETQVLADEMKGKKVVFLGVACRQLGDTEAPDFWKNNKFTYPLISKGGDEIARQFKVLGYPSICVIADDGTIAGFYQDNPGKDMLANTIRGGIKH